MTFNSQILDCDDSSWVEKITQRVRASTSVRLNFLSILHEKTYIFYFTYPLLQNIHISLSILHIYSIKYSFFYNFLLFPPSLPLSLTNPQSITTNDHSTPNQHHHHPTTIIKENQSTQFQIHSSPTQPETQSSQIITHPIGDKIIKTHQWTRKNKPIKIKTHWPTPTINQKTKKNPVTNRLERDRCLRPEQNRHLAAPPPLRDNHHHALHPAWDYRRVMTGCIVAPQR